MLLARMGSKANVVSPGRHSADEPALRRSHWQPCARRIRLRFTKRAIAPVHLRSTSATMEGQGRQGSQDGFTTSTSAVSCDDMGAVVVSEFRPPLGEYVLSKHWPLRVSTP
jgi:hypothetical protein